MKYYILEFDPDYDCILDENIPTEYKGISLNFGTPFNSLPMISITVGGTSLPNCIPNHGRYMYFDSKIRSIIQSFGFDKVEYFDVEVNSKNHDIPVGEYKVANFLNTIKAIDRSNSILDIDEDEEDEDGNIRDVLSLKLDVKAIEGEQIFRMIGYETLLVVRADVAQAIVNARCTGLEFIDADGYRV
jgi:hypothetical protein